MTTKIKIPKRGYFPRNKMPQLGPVDKFLENLKRHNIEHDRVTIDSSKLKPLQSEFDIDAVRSVMDQPRKTKSAIVISKDNYILDGHHRWLAHYNLGTDTPTIKVDMPAVELLKKVKSFENTSYKDINHVGTIKSVMKEAIESKIYK